MKISREEGAKISTKIGTTKLRNGEEIDIMYDLVTHQHFTIVGDRKIEATSWQLMMKKLHKTPLPASVSRWIKALKVSLMDTDLTLKNCWVAVTPEGYSISWAEHEADEETRKRYLRPLSMSKGVRATSLPAWSDDEVIMEFDLKIEKQLLRVQKEMLMRAQIIFKTIKTGDAKFITAIRG